MTSHKGGKIWRRSIDFKLEVIRKTQWRKAQSTQLKKIQHRSNMLPVQLIVKSFKVCALSSGLDGSEDNNIACVKHGPCQYLLSRLQAASLDENQTDPFDDHQVSISEGDIREEDIDELFIDPDDDGDEQPIVED